MLWVGLSGNLAIIYEPMTGCKLTLHRSHCGLTCQCTGHPVTGLVAQLEVPDPVDLVVMLMFLRVVFNQKMTINFSIACEVAWSKVCMIVRRSLRPSMRVRLESLNASGRARVWL